MKKIVFLMMLVMGVLLSSTSCLKRVGATETGIVENLTGSDRGVENDIKVESGWIFYNPFSKRIIKYPSNNLLVDYKPFSIQDKKGTEFTVDPTIEYQIEKDSAKLVYIRYKHEDTEDLEKTILLNEVKNAYKDVSGLYETDSIINYRPQFEGEVQRLLIERLANKGFTFKNIQSSVMPNEALQREINEKNAAIQRALKEENNKKAEQAKADQKVIAAEGEANANKKRQAALTPQVLEQMWIERWDGQLPVYGTVPTLFKDITK